VRPRIFALAQEDAAVRNLQSGLASTRRVLNALRRRAMTTTLTARDVMNPEVMALRDDLTAREAAAFLIENQIAGAPVVDGGGRLVGVVSLTDLAENESERPDIVTDAGPRLDERPWAETMDPADMRALHVESDDVLVRDIMTPAVYTTAGDTPVGTVARTMIAGRIHRLFVTHQGKVVGIVTPLDLLALLVDDAHGRDAAAAAAAGPSAIRAGKGTLVRVAGRAKAAKGAGRAARAR
jgi:CBS domain-containing protein